MRYIKGPTQLGSGILTTASSATGDRDCTSAPGTRFGDVASLLAGLGPRTYTQTPTMTIRFPFRAIVGRWAVSKPGQRHAVPMPSPCG